MQKKCLEEVMQIISLKKQLIEYLESENALKRMFSRSLSPKSRWRFLPQTINVNVISKFKDHLALCALYQQDVVKTEHEIVIFQQIAMQLTDEIDELKVTRKRLDFAQTFQGKYFHVLGHFFSVYCVWKIIISWINIVFNRVGKGK